MDKPYLTAIEAAEDLVTSYEETRAGFVALALEKNRLATPFVEQARALKVSASQATNPKGLLQIAEIQDALLTASGVSDKASGHMENQDKEEAKRGLVENFLEPAGEKFVEELVYRFLLTRGDTLGGSMRNIGGALAERKLTRAILAALNMSKIKYTWLDRKSKKWIMMSADDSEIDSSLKGITWNSGNGERTLIYNLTIPIVRKNVDICLFNCDPWEYRSIKAWTKPGMYLAYGELKGGIDPAGADEHWKTANSALTRVRKAFETTDHRPESLFIGAAIENSMAREIWDQLEDGTLSFAANLNNADQVALVCKWLLSI